MLPRVPTVAILALLAACASCKGKDGETGAAPAAPSASAPASAAPAPSSSAPVAAAAPAPPSGATFEGALTMQVSSGARPPAQITMITKGDRIRLDVPSANGPAAHSILDVARKQVLVVLDGPKIAITRPLPAPPPAAAASAPAQVTKTGKHETIAGHDCEDWNVVESSGKHSQLCMASGIPFFDFTQIAPPGSGQVFGAWMRDVKDASAFPLKAVTTDASGKEESTMQVTKIDPHPVDDSLFVAPPGYRSVGPPAGPPR